MYGVRISLLSTIGWIWAAISKALTALKEIRDNGDTRLLNAETNREIFHDVASINGYLDEKRPATNFWQSKRTTPSFANPSAISLKTPCGRDIACLRAQIHGHSG